MKILVDNKEFIINKTFNSFGELINEITKKLKTEDKILETIIVDGVVLNTASIVDISKVTLIEIFTKSHRNILYHSLFLLEEYIQEYFKSLKILEDYELDPFTYDMKINEILSFLNWTLNLLYSLKENTYVDYLYFGYNELLEEFKDSYNNLLKAIDSGDYETAFDILEFEISDMLSALGENIESYKKDILIDEDSSNHTN
ncbi:hypothetical protein [Fusobacterium perfoetens]|jgi:hypothetical protein|uniref:hypothetical protein n=1 Tax=Fusobacterium perfoetens TaxID=852 RepID=UPI001F3C7109|nr:hypothetical protein [Fusobacterium perfoetens]MCF2612100.1 hypothetical protein [Fusobacterium perfoetens]